MLLVTPITCVEGKIKSLTFLQLSSLCSQALKGFNVSENQGTTMKGTLKLIAATLVLMSTVASATSTDASSASKAVEGATRQEISPTRLDSTEYSHPTQTGVQNGFPLQLAQTAAGYCKVAAPRGSKLNVRATPGGKAIGSLRNGTNVALGVTNGSEGAQWTRIIQPLNGYVWRAYLRNCQER